MVNKSWSQNSQRCWQQAKGRVPHVQWRSMAFNAKEKIEEMRKEWRSSAAVCLGRVGQMTDVAYPPKIHKQTHPHIFTHISKCLFPNTHPDCVWTQTDEHTCIKDTYKPLKPDIVFVICLFSLNCLVPSLWPNNDWWLNLHFGCSNINSSKQTHYLCSFTWQTQVNKLSLNRSVQDSFTSKICLLKCKELMNFTISTINTILH